MLNIKRRYIFRIAAAFAVVLSTVNAALCANEKFEALKPSIVKFSLVLLAIVFFMMLIYIGLSVYNRFFVESKFKDYKLKKYSLDSASDTDEAILNYISKNKLE